MGRAPDRGSIGGVWRGHAGAVTLVIAMLPACYGTEEIEQPVALFNAESIAYPLSLWDEGVEGRTLLRVRVTEEGAVDSILVEESAGHAAFDSAAVQGVRGLSFQPGRRNGERVRMWATIPIFFSRPR